MRHHPGMADIPSFDTSGFSLEPYARRIDKPWGYEVLLSPPDAPYTSKLIAVNAGKQLSLQVHDVKVETQTLVSGQGTLVVEGPDGELHEVDMQPGVGYHVAVGQRHRLRARTDIVVFEASSPEAGTTYRLADDYARPHETETLRAQERGQAG
jgi:mannose-6-phosphate isomerase-like protein (cupin superfamily)